MFPLQQRGELFFHNSSDHNQRHKIPEDQILSPYHHHHHHDVGYLHDDHPQEAGRVFFSEIDNKEEGRDYMGDYPKKRRVGCKKLKRCGGGGGHESGNGDKKKMVHRDIERQRRQDMASLYSSLRSLLPLEFIKGKRSISDQVNEAANYIKHLQRNIKELSCKRDELVTTLYGNIDKSYGSSIENSGDVTVVVRPSVVGVEIMFSSSCCSHALPQLSVVLQVLLQEGLCVLSCISSKLEGRFIHTIMGEVKEPAGVQISDLQDRLKGLLRL